MTIITERQGTLETLIDDVADALLAHTEWSDADSDIDNSGTDESDEPTNNWRSNGRVLAHSDMGIFLLFFARADNSTSSGTWRAYDIDGIAGVRAVISTDWDTQMHRPSGKTTAISEDPFSVGNTRGSSFTHHSTGAVSGSADLWTMGSGTYGDFDYYRNYPVTYFASARSDGLTIATWETSNSSRGAAGFWMLEHVDEKFWEDGAEPFVMAHVENVSGGGGHGQAYGFRSYRNDRGSRPPWVVADGGAFDRGEWGRINSDAIDDTFFFRRPVIYSAPDREYPVSYIYDAIPNNINEGAAHGDIISHDGTDYRVFRQSGAGESSVVSVGLRYE